MKSKARSELPSKIASTQAKIKPVLEELAAKYDEALTTLEHIIDRANEPVILNLEGISTLFTWTITSDTPATGLSERFKDTITDDMLSPPSHNNKKPPLLKLDTEYVRIVKRAFDAVDKGMEYIRVGFEGDGPHLNQNTSYPCEVLHATFCGSQGEHFKEIIKHYCSDNPKLKATLTAFVDDLNKALEPFVQELHKTVNACKVSYNEEGELVIKFSSDKIAEKMMKQYASASQTGSQTDPVKLEGDHIVVRGQSTQYQDVGVSSGTTVFLHSKQERDAFLRLFEGSTNLVSTGTADQKAVYFAADKAGYHNLPVEFIGSNMEFCGDW